MRTSYLVGVALLASTLSAQTIVQSFQHAMGNGFVGGVAYDPIDDSIWVFDEGQDTITAYTRNGALLRTIAAPLIPGGTACPNATC